MHSALLRAQMETALGERVSSPFTDIERRVWECISSGIPALDAATGGLPRGAIVEICGGPSSGKTTLALSFLAAMCRRDEVCALVDGADTFDPESGEAAGLDLRRLLWVRCRNVNQVLRSTDLLLQGGGFGVVAIDLSDLSQKALHSVPLATWFRFQRIIENTPTVLLIIGRESAAKSAATLVLSTNVRQADWPSTGEGFSATPSPSHGLLLAETHLDIEIRRSRHSELRKPRVQHHVRLHSCS